MQAVNGVAALACTVGSYNKTVVKFLPLFFT